MGNKLNKKILFLPSWYPSKDNLTLGNFVKKHVEIANDVAEIDVLYAISSAAIDKTIIDDQLMNGVRTVIVYYPKQKSKFPIIKSIVKKNAYLEALKQGYKHLNKVYDFVHLNITFPAGMFAQWIKKSYGIPYILTEHWTGFLPQNPVFDRFPFHLKKKYKSILVDADRVYTVSDHLGQAILNKGLIEKYEVIHNVVSTDYFYPVKQKRDEDAPVRFIHVSTCNDEHKNISGMLRVFGKLQHDFILHVITEGAEEEIWKAIDKFNIAQEKCIVESQKTAKEVGEAMRLADCLVLFSNYETFSVVLAEAWSTGIPVIYTKCGGLTEINNPDLGVQLTIGDEAALLKSLNEFEKSSYSTQTIAQFGAQFSSPVLREFFRKIYE